MRNVTKLGLAAIFNQNIFFFQILFQKWKCIHVLLLWVKFYWNIPLEQCFFKFWSCDYFRETDIRYLANILKRNIFCMFSLLIYGCFRCIQMWCNFRTEKKNGWVQVDPPLPWCKNGMKSSLGTSVLRYFRRHCGLLTRTRELKQQQHMSS